MAYLNDRQIGWLAGIIDGEGSIALHQRLIINKRSVEHYILRLQIRMIHEETIKTIARFAGCGTICNPSVKNKNHKSSYQWSCTNKQALFVLNLVKDNLITKKNQCLIAFEFGEIYDFRKKDKSKEVLNKSHFLFLKMSELNERGIK